MSRMWQRGKDEITRFFYLSMLYMNLRSYYEMLHVMHTYLNYNHVDVYNMYPFERDIFLLMYKNDKEMERKKMNEQRAKHGKLPI